MITWNLALDPKGGPHNGGCDTCTGVVTIDPATGKATREADYYALGDADEVRQAGRGRIALDGRGQHLERRVPQPRRLDGRARQQRRLGHGLQRFNLKQGSKELSDDLPAGAVATFVID